MNKFRIKCKYFEDNNKEFYKYGAGAFCFKPIGSVMNLFINVPYSFNKDNKKSTGLMLPIAREEGKSSWKYIPSKDKDKIFLSPSIKTEGALNLHFWVKDGYLEED